MAAAYLGIIDVPLRTFTTSYVPFNGGSWTWQTYALQPMEFMGRLTATDVAAVACAVFDNATGITKFSFGDITAGVIHDDHSGALLWKRTAGNAGMLAGWVFNGPGTRTPFNLSQIVTLGIDLATGLNVINPFGTLPGKANTAIPDPFFGGGWYDEQGLIQSSYRVELAPFFAAYDPFSGGMLFEGPTTIVGSTSFEFAFSIPYAAVNWVWVGDTTGGTPNKHVLITQNFIVADNIFVPHLANPPGSSVDLDAYINAVGTINPTGTYKGFLWIVKDPITISGRTLNGYAILVNPPFDFYYILNFVPIDATAHSWNTGPGGVEGKFDDTGILFLKDASSPDTVFASAVPPIKIIETYPPIGLPTPPHDSQITLRAMRGYSI